MILEDCKVNGLILVRVREKFHLCSNSNTYGFVNVIKMYFVVDFMLNACIGTYRVPKASFVCLFMSESHFGVQHLRVNWGLRIFL